MSWAHHHGEACRSCPNLKEVLEGQCLGSVKAVWSCVDGHRYTMDTRQSAATNLRCTLSISNGRLGGVGGDGVASEEDEQEVVENEEAGEDSRTTPTTNTQPTVTPQDQSSDADHWSANTKGEAEAEAVVEIRENRHVIHPDLLLKSDIGLISAKNWISDINDISTNQ